LYPKKRAKSSFFGRGNKDFMSLRESSENWEKSGLKVKNGGIFSSIEPVDRAHSYVFCCGTGRKARQYPQFS
jgi:hypothetical protein